MPTKVLKLKEICSIYVYVWTIFNQYFINPDSFSVANYDKEIIKLSAILKGSVSAK